ncbi:succinate dehydrogenase/fumarate reductase flavoprotein subunit [Pseudacidovorax intermedius]|uniref:Succinate dehydrogenase/fumarate reductase flavoprotein subunit n=1 Tax=Pseudacidovorax intermedius TaxID=433924 RepID=A0A370FN33_9BURK|nr:FAD-dependent oxidoreductase [Pseudacidovorax intermedius]RDI28663.1 succinate dehydrogenase/fumarate reductase flavoprotein subunit [Pseudacidovorax intermedius]
MKRLQTLADLPEGAAFDLVVVGAGGAGMAAALFAALEGQQVLLVERTAHVGGTTAWSAGTCWVPGTREGAAVNPADTLAEAARYLDNAIGEHSPRALRQAFLDHGAEAIAQLAARTEVKLRAYPRHPDYISDLDGSTVAGRALEPLPFDGRLLGEWFALLRPPIPEFTVLGGMMVDRTDINHLLGMTKSFASLRHSVRILARHGRDRLRHARGTRLVMGNALVGRLLYSLSRLPNVTLAMETELMRLQRNDAGIDGVVLAQRGQRRSVAARAGVVLASGGFNRHPERRQALLPGADIGWCPGAPGHTGEAHALAEAVGARYGSGAMSPAFWAPVSRRTRADGSTALFPHFVMDRAKPGVLAVNAAGERFVNESTSYHLFGLAMQQPGVNGQPSIPAFLICDAAALRKYGLGMVRPGGKGLAPFLADGYLTQADTLAGLAQSLGIDASRLQATVERFNTLARSGVDSDFHRGETAYQRNLGDPAWPGPNPCLGPLEEGPFYAVRLYPGDIGAAQGFATDADARVLDAQGQPIAGLYAVGNDMHSIMGGVYTAPGITLGPGIVFAHLAARHAAARLREAVAT